MRPPTIDGILPSAGRPWLMMLETVTFEEPLYSLFGWAGWCWIGWLLLVLNQPANQLLAAPSQPQPASLQPLQIV
jgi:hypothetical protein